MSTRYEEALEDTRWRVRFRQSLLEAHRAERLAGAEWAGEDHRLFQMLKGAKNMLQWIENAAVLGRS